LEIATFLNWRVLMNSCEDFGALIRARCAEMGVTPKSLKKLSGLSNGTVYSILGGTLQNLSLSKAIQLLQSLGLEFLTGNLSPRLEVGTALAQAAVVASLKHTKLIREDFLRRALTEHVHLGDYAFHLHHLLEEGELALLCAVVDQLNNENGVDKPETWKRMRAIAKQLKVSRPLWA
jgi:hypothetical protein